MKQRNIAGMKFHKLTAVWPVPSNIKYRRMWLFICECGNAKEMEKGNVVQGLAKSCGCVGSVKTTLKKNFIHGLSKTRIYRIYFSMKTRCEKPNHSRYRFYGGRGIKCLWEDFDHFYQDMFASYKKHCKEAGEANTTIERIDFNGNYCKENCRWATQQEQKRNTRRNVFIEFQGKKKTISEWSRELGLNHRSVSWKLRHGHSSESALQKPTKDLSFQ